MHTNMPDLQKTSVVAILTADWHFWDIPPRARSKEKNWLEKQQSYLVEVYNLAKKHKAPVLVAGDIFHKPNANPKTINALVDVIDYDTYCVPGNHDLENYSYADLHKTAYWTLVNTKKIIHITRGTPKEFGSVRIHGFACDVKVKPLKNRHSLLKEIALIHSFIWTKNTGFEGAPKESRAKKWANQLEGYDIAVFGDNHKPFTTKVGNTIVYNCGSLYRRNVDQIDHTPSVGLLKEDGKITRHYLDVTEDLIEDPEDKEVVYNIDIKGVLQAIAKTNGKSIDYVEACEEWIKSSKPSRRVKELILQSMNKNEKPTKAIKTV